MHHDVAQRDDLAERANETGGIRAGRSSATISVTVARTKPPPPFTSVGQCVLAAQNMAQASTPGAAIGSSITA